MVRYFIYIIMGRVSQTDSLFLQICMKDVICNGENGNFQRRNIVLSQVITSPVKPDIVHVSPPIRYRCAKIVTIDLILNFI